MHDPLARLLELRLLYRRNPQARAFVDRALVLVAEAQAQDADLEALDAEAGRLAEDLAVRFGARAVVRAH